MSTETNVTHLTPLFGAPFDEAEGHCDKHGDYTATVLVIKGEKQEPQCSICMHDLIKAEREAAASEMAERARVKARQARLERMNLPTRMLDKRWSDYKPATAEAQEHLHNCKRFAADWADTSSKGANLIMTGSTGNGKTHLASVLCKQVGAENNAQPLYTTLSAMLRYVRASFGKGCSYTESEAMQRYAMADLLVIDEVGVKLSSEYDKSTTFEIIDMRYQEKLPSIVISNLSVKEINEHIDARLVDRLTENGLLMIFNWESHRGMS